MPDLKPYLDDLEERIDPTVEDQLLNDWKTFTDGRFNGDLFSPRRATKREPGLEWPGILINDALEDKDLMLLRELKPCSNMLANGGGAPMAIRANYGTAILSSLFGVEIFYMDHAMNTLPTNRPLEGGKDAIRLILDRGTPDVHGSLGGRVFEWADYVKDILSEYPNIRKYVAIYHPDAQGPMDVCELVWGSSLFMDVMDEPDLVKALLDLITETYTAYMRKWASIAPLKTDYSAHWGIVHQGAIMLRDDSAMNFSPDMFDEFIRPYDQALLDEFGGGAIHFCGRGSHYIRSMCGMDGLFAINMSQPSYNDMEEIYANTVDKGIKLIGLSRQAAEDALASGRDLHGNVHCA